MPHLTQKRIDDLVRNHFRDRLVQANETVWFAGDPTAYNREQEIVLVRRDAKKYREQLAIRKYDPITRFQARDVVSSAGITVDEGSEAFETLCHGILRASAELMRVYDAKLRGAYDETDPRDPLFSGVVTDELPLMPGERPIGAERKLAAIAQEYYAFKSKHGWAPKTRVEIRRALDWFCEVVGPGRKINSLAADDVKRFRDILLKLPANHAKLSVFDGMSLEQIAKRYEGDATLSANSAKKYFANMRAFLGWAVDEEYLEKMPGPNIKLGLSIDSQDARHPFSTAQLPKLFTSPQFTGHASPSRR